MTDDLRSDEQRHEDLILNGMCPFCNTAIWQVVERDADGVPTSIKGACRCELNTP